MSNGKSGFTLASVPQVELKKEGIIISLCAGADPLVVTVADLEAQLVALGCVSINDPANPPQIVRAYSTVVPKGRETTNHIDDTQVIATGERVTYTDEKGKQQFIYATEKAGSEKCLIDANCDSIPDDTIPDAVAWEIPAGSCAKFELDVA